MELAMTLTAVSSAALIGPWLVAAAGTPRDGRGQPSGGGGRPPGRRTQYTLAA